jgi:hypothetical protein
MDVGTNRVLRVVATLEFIQHQLSEMGHSDLLVTQTLHWQQHWGRPEGATGTDPSGPSEEGEFGPL